MGRIRRRAILVACGVMLACVVAARFVRPTPTHMTRAEAVVLALNAADETEATSAAGCGVELWPIKTMSDLLARRVRLIPVRTTIAALRRLRTPAELGTTRIAPVEFRTYRVAARLVAFKREADSDIHLVVADPRSGATMIVELPQNSCVARATAVVRARMVAARAAVLAKCGLPSSSRFTALRGTATVTGVGFFDFLHGQTGVAPNGIELHPVLGFTGSCNSSRPPPPPPPPPGGGRCAASYPDHCIPPPPPDLDCGDIPWRNFRVLWNVPDPDPHHFDGNRNGIGCES